MLELRKAFIIFNEDITTRFVILQHKHNYHFLRYCNIRLQERKSPNAYTKKVY